MFCFAILQNILMQSLDQFLSYPHKQKIASLPIEFPYLPVDILAKQYTKLNSPYEQRIHYLGPRFPNSLALHKKLSFSELSPYTPACPDRLIPKYALDNKKIVDSLLINERLRSNNYYKPTVYYRAFEGMNPSADLSKQFIFNSCYESGNLDCVIKIKPNEFDLFLRVDSNTRGHLQWFNFSIENGKLTEKISLHLCNVSRPGTFYESGMAPYFFSKKAFECRKQGWRQGNKNISNIRFAKKPFRQEYKEVFEDKFKSGNVFCYSFEYQFQFEDDQVHFSYCIPYTYSEMLTDMLALPSHCTRIHRFARSLSGLDILMLHITDHEAEDVGNKKNILVTGRIHPGQSNSSHVLKGFIEYLCSDKQNAKLLRNLTNFFVIPMLNPDGVVLGNTRSGISGRDLNRMFIGTNSRQIFPEVHALKMLVSKFMKTSSILLYYDFHGHSRKKNTFFYGPDYSLAHPNYYKSRVLARLIEKMNNGFRFWSCIFQIKEHKKTTGRAYMFNNAQIPYTFTVQSSIGSFYDSEQLKTFPYSLKGWRKMGEDVCEGTSQFIISHQEYERIIKLKRDIRQKKKIEKASKKGIQQKNDHTIEDESMKIKPNDREECHFLRALEEVKIVIKQKLNKNRQLDQQVSSDDHDDKEDLEEGKIKELNSLIIDNCKYSRKYQKDKFEEFEPLFPHEFRKKLNQMEIESSELKFMNSKFIQEDNDLLSNQKRVKEEIMKRKSFKQKFLKSPKNFGSQKEQKLKNGVEKHKFTQARKEEQNYFISNTIYSDKKKIVIGSFNRTKIKMKNSHFNEIQFPSANIEQKGKIQKQLKTDFIGKRKQFPYVNLQKAEKSQSSTISPSKKSIMIPQNKTKIRQLKIEDLITNLRSEQKALNVCKFKKENKIKSKSCVKYNWSFYAGQVKQGKRQFSGKGMGSGFFIKAYDLE